MNMLRIGFVSALGAIVLCTLVAPPQARAESAPVSIERCAPNLTPMSSSSPAPSFLGVPLASKSTGMAITFVNNASAVAKLVNFAVDSNGSRFVIRDVGTFSPGITIAHTYANGSGQGFLLPQFIAPKVTCHVSSVEFADGSVWHHGQSASGGSTSAGGSTQGDGLTATPARVRLDLGSESALFFVQSPGRVAGFKETDNCAGIAGVYLGSTGDASATFSVRPLGHGSCTAHVINENGATVAVPISVR